MDLRPIAKSVSRFPDVAIAELIERLLSQQLKGPHAKLLIARLTGASLKTTAKATLAVAERLLKVTGEFFEKSRAVARRNLTRSHCFGPAFASARADPARASYFRTLDEVRELIDSAEGRRALRDDPTLRKSAESLRNQLSENVGYGVFESYKDLKRETGAFNKLNSVLTPKDCRRASRFDAHHIVEARAFEKFKDEWKLVGWTAEEDMMATALQYESHILSSSSGKMPGFEDQLDAIPSVTARLRDEIKIEKIANAPDLIDAYIRFYKAPRNVKGKTGQPLLGADITNRIVTALEELKVTVVQAKKKSGSAAVVGKLKKLK